MTARHGKNTPELTEQISSQYRGQVRSVAPRWQVAKRSDIAFFPNFLEAPSYWGYDQRRLSGLGARHAGTQA
jgi:hypothetical protein